MDMREFCLCQNISMPFLCVSQMYMDTHSIVNEGHCPASHPRIELVKKFSHSTFTWEGRLRVVPHWPGCAGVLYCRNGTNPFNGFDIIQSQPLRSSFKLIISFTFSSLSCRL